MVKGVSKRVIVVRSPDPRIFDEAIFIVRDDALKKSGVSAEDLLREAQEAAGSYLKTNLQKKWRFLRRIPSALWLCAGAGLASAVWALAAFL